VRGGRRIFLGGRKFTAAFPFPSIEAEEREGDLEVSFVLRLYNSYKIQRFK